MCAVLCAVNPGHWTVDMRDDALEPAKLDDPGLKVRCRSAPALCPVLFCLAFWLGACVWQLQPAARWQVVDVGGGTGFCTQGVVKTVPAHNVTLIDQSPHQLEKARKKADLQGVTIVEVRSAVHCP